MGEWALRATLFAPFLGVVVLLFVPNRHPLLVRAVAAVSAGIALLASLFLFLVYDADRGGFQFITRWVWSEELGIAFHIGVDGIGTPLVQGASVRGVITAQARGPKITVFKMKRRKNYRSKNGHRQHYTEVRVDSIEG